ncbi:hypothetical protein Dimus_015781 [Dionaea muscipula]
MEITIFVDNLPNHVGRREIFSIFNTFGCISDVFIASKRRRSGFRFGFVTFNYEVAAGLTILNNDGMKMKDKTLLVKRVVYGRKAPNSIMRPRMPSLRFHEQREMRSDRMPRSREGSTDAPLKHHSITGGGPVMSYVDALKGLGKMGVAGLERKGCDVPHPIVITRESHGVEQLQRSCVITWRTDSCSGTHALSLFLELGVKVKVVVLDRSKCLLVFDNDDSFKKVLALDRSWCPTTFLSIRRQWGKVLFVEFGFVDSGFLDDGRIKLLTDIVTPCSFAFKLLVDGKSFDCWVVEDGSFSMRAAQDCHDVSRSSGFVGSGKSGEDHRTPGSVGFFGLLLGVALAEREEERSSQDLFEMSSPDDFDRARDPLHCSDGGRLEGCRLRETDQRRELDLVDEVGCEATFYDCGAEEGYVEKGYENEFVTSGPDVNGLAAGC